MNEDKKEEIKQIEELVCNASGITEVAMAYCCYNEYSPLHTTLLAAQKYQIEAMERLSNLW